MISFQMERLCSKVKRFKVTIIASIVNRVKIKIQNNSIKHITLHVISRHFLQVKQLRSILMRMVIFQVMNQMIFKQKKRGIHRMTNRSQKKDHSQGRKQLVK